MGSADHQRAHLTSRPKLPSRTDVPSDARVLVLLAHPALHRSRVNGPLARAARAVPGVTVHDLYESYPDHDVDVPHEQALLLAHDVVVLQHPFYWYSTPSLVKEWIDQVLLFGWAYGPNGNALMGKTWIHAFSTGGPAEAYGPEGHNRFTLRQLLAPLEQTAKLCGMRFLPPFAIHGSLRLDTAAIAEAASRYQALLTALREGLRPRDDSHERTEVVTHWEAP